MLDGEIISAMNVIFIEALLRLTRLHSSVGNATRTCAEKGIWASANFTGCSSDEFNKLADAVSEMIFCQSVNPINNT